MFLLREIFLFLRGDTEDGTDVTLSVTALGVADAVLEVTDGEGKDPPQEDLAHEGPAEGAPVVDGDGTAGEPAAGPEGLHVAEGEHLLEGREGIHVVLVVCLPAVVGLTVVHFVVAVDPSEVGALEVAAGAGDDLLGGGGVGGVVATGMGDFAGMARLDKSAGEHFFFFLGATKVFFFQFSLD